MTHELTHLDLFSGIGGFALAAQRAGFRTVGFSEIEPYACRVLAERFPGVPNLGDVRKRESFAGVGPVTVLTGGFPCQPWSITGKRKGTSDDRHLWPAMLGVVETVRPTWVLGENVLNLERMGGIDTALDDLEAIGYETGAFVIPACATGKRQMRFRVWPIGYDSNANRNGLQGGIRQCSTIFAPWSQVEFEGLVQISLRRCVPSRGGCGISDGIPNRTHRLKGLGNAIVPQVVEPFFHWIRQIETGEIGE